LTASSVPSPIPRTECGQWRCVTSLQVELAGGPRRQNSRPITDKCRCAAFGGLPSGTCLRSGAGSLTLTGSSLRHVGNRISLSEMAFGHSDERLKGREGEACNETGEMVPSAERP
jgi:hypothetical protein